MKRLPILLAVAVVLPAAGCMTKPRHLYYPQGVTITGWHRPDFEIVNWNRDANNPQPCPLVVHLPSGDLGEKELADANGLRRAGWTERDIGNGVTELMLRVNPPMVRCWYQGGVLTGVEVNTLSGNGAVPACSASTARRSRCRRPTRRSPRRSANRSAATDTGAGGVNC
jgi:hypothetical protein